MRILVSAFGSAGDFVPALAIGRALARRGHEVRFVGNPFHEGRVRSAGVDFVPAGERCDLYGEIAREPRYLQTSWFRRLFDDVVTAPGLAIHRRTADLLDEGGTDLVVTADVNFGAVWAAEEKGVPSAIVYASPAAWAQWRSPLVFGDLWLPRAIAAPLTAVGKRVLQWELSRTMARLARGAGVASTGRSFIEMLRAAPLHLAMWSPALRGPLPGDLATGRICGFVHGSTLGDEEPEVPPVIEDFLAAGAPPVVVGLGSIFPLAAGRLLECLTYACAEVGQRCLVLGDPPGASLHPAALAVPYAPYDRVFPRASVVVVHGGAGTTGEALRSGRSVLGVPFAFDQFTLCAWLERLGVGVRIGTARRDVARLASVLRRLLSDPAIAGTAVELGARVAAERDGSEVAADAIERLQR